MDSAGLSSFFPSFSVASFFFVAALVAASVVASFFAVAVPMFSRPSMMVLGSWFVSSSSSGMKKWS